jgi:hypothetical protein
MVVWSRGISVEQELKVRRGVDIGEQVFVFEKVVLSQMYGTTKPQDVPRWLPILKPAVDLWSLQAQLHHFAHIDVTGFSLVCPAA